MPSLSTQARIASITAFAEARRIRPIRQRPSLPGQMRLPLSGDNCERNPGGTFAVGNNCQGGGDGQASTSDDDRRFGERLSTADNDDVLTFGASDAPVPGFERSSEVKISQPQDVARVSKRLSLSATKLASLAVADEPDAKVLISGSSDYVMVTSKVPLPFKPPSQFTGYEGTGAKIVVDVGFDSASGKKYVEYGNFSVSQDVQDGLAKHAQIMRQPEAPWSDDEKAFAEFGQKASKFFGEKIIALMGRSLIDAEEAGINYAETYAAGRGRGEGAGAGEANSFAYKGYSLWPRFGFDGPIPGMTSAKIEPILSDILSEGPESRRRGVLSEDGWQKFTAGGVGSLKIQDLVETPQGERLWRDHGQSARITLDFSDKTSKGYQRYARMKKSIARARRRGDESRFYAWLAETEFRFDTEIFFVERRMARFLESRNCGTGAGGFQKGNTCGGAAADVAAAAAEGAVAGAAVAAGKTAFFPPTVATGAAVGAAYGVIGGLYDAAMSPTRAGKAIAAVGSTDEKVATLVKGLGGSPKSVAKSKDGKRLTLDIKGSKGNSKFKVEIEKDSITITPSKESLSSGEVEAIKKVAADHSGREVRVVVDKVPVSTMSKLAKAGFRIGVTVAGGLAAGLLIPVAPAVAGTAVEKVSGIDIERTGVLKHLDKLFGL